MGVGIASHSLVQRGTSLEGFRLRGNAADSQPQASGFLASQRDCILAFALRQPIIRRALRRQPVLFQTAFTFRYSSR